MVRPVFRYPHRVTYAECVVGNHIYYGRYLELLEAARGEFFRQAGAPLIELQQQDVVFPVIECRLRYKAPARYDDMLTVEVSVALIEGVRLNFEYRILNQTGALILEAETFHVCAGLNERPRRFPPDLPQKLRPDPSVEQRG